MVQEEERRRVARDVHDQMGQPMTALRMQLESLRARADAFPALTTEVSRTMRLAQELDQSIDFLTWQLRPAALDHLGVSAALSDLVRGVVRAVPHCRRLRRRRRARAALSNDVSVNLYRIVQEALHNVQKHARASRVSVLFTVRDAVAVLVDRGQRPGLHAGAARSGAE